MSPARSSSSASASPAGRPRPTRSRSEDFAALAKAYGRIGGLDRIATVVKAIRAERGDDRVLFLDGGDTWQDSYTALATKGQDMVDVHEAAAARRHDRPLGVHARRRAGEGDRRRRSASRSSAQNVRDADWTRPVFEPMAMHRARRRQGRDDRPGLPLHADRQPALVDAELVVRHPRGGAAGERRRSARQGRREARRAAVAQRLRRRPQARVARARASTSSSPATPTTRCREPVRVGKTLLVASG